MSMVKLQLGGPKVAYFTGNTFSYKDLIKAIPGSSWNKKDKRWEIPLESTNDALRIFPSLVVDTEVQKAFGSLRQRQQAAIAVKTDDSKAITKVPGLKGTLRTYQGRGLNFLAQLGAGEGGILGFDMGTGKSLTGLAYYLYLKSLGVVDRLLVVCPSPLKYATWAKEVAKWTDLECQVIDGDGSEVVEWDDGTKERLTGRKLREVQYQQQEFGVDVTIMNYELFLHDMVSERYEKVRALTEEELERLEQEYEYASQRKGLAKSNKKVKQAALSAFLGDLLPNPKGYTIRGNKTPELVKVIEVPRIIPNLNQRWLVVLDEAHRIKNPQAQMTKALLSAAKPAGRKVLATGTPLENNIQEIWSLADLCRPNLLGTYYKFEDRYIEKDYFNRPVAPKPQMMPELREKLDPIMIRVTKEEALPELPPLTPMLYEVKMTELQKALYEQIKEGIVMNMETEEFSYLEVIVQLTRLQQLLDSPALLRPLLGNPNLPIESGKLNELDNVIKDMDPSRHKFILFSQYREMTDILYEWLTEDQLDEGGKVVHKAILPKSKVGYVKGGVKATEIERIRKEFQEGGMQCVLMTTAGNYGLDLFAGSYVIAYDQLFNPQKMEQIYSRAHRGGNTTGVTAVNFVTKGSYEEKKMKVLEGKREIFKALIDADDETFARMFTKQDLMDMI